jgi:hypothetical protein
VLPPVAPLFLLADTCLNNGGMPAWDRLAEYVVRRRVELGYKNRPALVANSSIGLRTLGDIETGRRTSYDRSTIAAIEDALRWRSGSVAAVLEGGEPVAAGEATAQPSTVDALPAFPTGPSDDPVVRIMRRDDLTEEQKAKIIRTLLREQDDYARRRAEELIREAQNNG